MIETVFNSFLLVAASEMGDKTQLLAFVLASRFKKPWTIFWGIFVATVLNHLLASWVGSWVSEQLGPQLLKWILSAVFIGFALWILIPDKEEEISSEARWGAFLTTVVTFFLAEMGDKTQLATVAMAAKYQDILWVTFGTTMGMMFSDGLAVFIGDKITQKIPLKYLRWAASFLFFVFGVFILFSFNGV